MKIDIRAAAAAYYDLTPSTPHDVPFYVGHIPSPNAAILELGCGTGRVTLPLVAQCGTIHGIDLSPAMIAVCLSKLADAQVPPTSAQVEVGDITDFALDRTFDLIIAPFRVLQNLEADAEVGGLFRCVREHLARGGTCILNVFKPSRDRDSLRREWYRAEKLSWEVQVPGGRVTCHDRRLRMDAENLILYPDLVYRRYEGDVLVDEAVLKLVMRCYYPDEFEELIVSHGFTIVNRWVGYEGEAYGEGPELVIQFALGA